jgi:hypothetical protein
MPAGVIGQLPTCWERDDDHHAEQQRDGIEVSDKAPDATMRLAPTRAMPARSMLRPRNPGPIASAPAKGRPKSDSRGGILQGDF